MGRRVSPETSPEAKAYRDAVEAQLLAEETGDENEIDAAAERVHRAWSALVTAATKRPERSRSAPD